MANRICPIISVCIVICGFSRCKKPHIIVLFATFCNVKGDVWENEWQKGEIKNLFGNRLNVISLAFYCRLHGKLVWPS